jgi:AraC family transcriptional regulator of adaptative response/methylated-DNA-[protein]-cysteine methyltransferase
MKRSLLSGETVTKAIYNAGFSSRSRFYENGSYRFGMSPGVLRRGGVGMRIRYTIVNCPVEKLLVGGTEFGICAVCIRESDRTVERALSEQYPSAIRERSEESMREWVERIPFWRGNQSQPSTRHTSNHISIARLERDQIDPIRRYRLLQQNRACHR